MLFHWASVRLHLEVLPPSPSPPCLSPVCPFAFCLLPPNFAIPIWHGIIAIAHRVSLAFDKATFLTNMRPCDVFASHNLLSASKVRAFGIIWFTILTSNLHLQSLTSRYGSTSVQVATEGILVSSHLRFGCFLCCSSKSGHLPEYGATNTFTSRGSYFVQRFFAV